MKVDEVHVSKIRIWEFNNRHHKEQQVERIAKSIEEFGFTNPILIDEDGVILAGHGRFFASDKLGLAKVPCITISGLNDEQKRAYRILDNKLTEDSTWDFNNLELELGFLEDQGFDLPAFGLDELKSLFPEDEPEIEDDDVPDAPSDDETFISIGDLIELGPHRVLCGDATCPDSVVACIGPEKAVDLMVTDPPYGVEYDPSYRSKNEKKQGKVSNDDRVDWTEAWKLWEAPVGYVWHASLHTASVKDSLEKAGYKTISQIIWNKERFAMGRGDYHWKHEPCWYVAKEGYNHNWQGARDQSTVWDIKAREDSGHGHSTQKPLEAMARPIRNNSAKGQVICDPFLGFGTTLIACDQLGRVCFGTEIEPKYCQIIIERYRQQCEKNKKPFECLINGERHD